MSYEVAGFLKSRQPDFLSLQKREQWSGPGRGLWGALCPVATQRLVLQEDLHI